MPGEDPQLLGLLAAGEVRASGEHVADHPAGNPTRVLVHTFPIGSPGSVSGRKGKVMLGEETISKSPWPPQCSALLKVSFNLRSRRLGNRLYPEYC